MPFKDFAAGDILTASDVDNFLMRQSVMTFDDATDRSTSLGTAVAEGMVAYLLDTNSLEYYDSSAWQPLSSGPTFTSSTATTYTIATADAGNYLRFTSAATVTVGTATDFSAGQQVQIFADGSSLAITTDGATIAGAGTAFTSGTFTVGNQYEAVSVFCVDTDTYRVIGNVSVV